MPESKKSDSIHRKLFYHETAGIFENEDFLALVEDVVLSSRPIAL